MSISPKSLRSDPLSPPLALADQNPSSHHGESALLSPRSGGSPPSRGGGAPADSPRSESAVAPTGDPLNPSQKVIGFTIPNSENSTETQSSDKAGSSSQNQNNNSRKNQGINANYLLNFQYDPITRNPPNRSAPQRKQRKIKPYNKDLFLQANYKFVVLDTGNYKIESMDPDKMLQWEDIICVRHRTAGTIQCPICLEAPLCPQITSCGHIYCFPCILQYLLMDPVSNSKTERFKRCPLCFMMVSTKDLYTVLIENVEQLRVGDVATFALLTRSKTSLLPTLKNENKNANFSSNESFSKFVLTSDVDLLFKEAKMGLSDWLKKADSGLVDDLERLPFVCEALSQLEERMKYWMQCKAFTGTGTGISPPKSTGTGFGTGSDGSLRDLGFEKENGEEKGVEEKEGDSYTFYQSADGQLLILHPLNVKCLLHHFGSYDMLPPRISGKILELETVTQSEEMRRRYRFLSHFSLTTTFQLCEIEMGNIVPASSLSPFMEEIKKREKQRKRLARKEQNDRAKAEALAVVEGIAPDPRLYSYSHKDVNFSLDDFEALGNNSQVTSSATSSSNSPPPGGGERKLFSDVTRLGYASGHDSPSLKKPDPLASSSSSTPQGPMAGSTLSFASIISSNPGIESPDLRNGNGIPVGKKGKKQNRVLLSTSGGRRY
ncbi:hypothetical protein LUZ60_004891 [Juncus effusus]|nr:hypothetical protein LUZ60_004891 [Juncus effusus]